MSDYLDAVAALGLIGTSDIRRQLGGDDDFGKASLLLETTFDQQACERAVRSRRPPPDQASTRAIGRQRCSRLVKPSDPDAYRRLPLTNNALWKTMKDAGQPHFRFILPPPITGGDDGRRVRVGVVAAD